LAGILLLLHLCVRRIDFTRLFQWTCPAAVIICAGAVWLEPGPTTFWGGRWATYFVDPLTFGQYILLLGFLSLFMINSVEKDTPAAVALKLAAFLIGVALSAGSGSRSAWLAAPALMAIWLTVIVRDLKLVALGLVATVLSCLLAYSFMDMIHLRIDAAINEYSAYFSGGNRDSSAGLRLSLARAVWHLFALHPLQGFGDRGLPPLQSIEAIAPFYTPELEYVINHHGAHNEILQNLIRSGIFGLVSTLLLLIVPFLIFISAVRSRARQVVAPAVLGLGYITALFFFGLNTEIFNLKFLCSFYAIMIPALAAQVIWADTRGAPPPGRKCDAA
jgi:O-antigen ligase